MKSKTLRAGLAALCMAGAIGATSGCGFTNPSVPAGHEGYRVNKPYFMGKHEFIDTLKGPVSTGLAWRDFVDPVIDMRPQTYSEDFEILSKDNLNVKFQAHAIIKLRDGSCQEVVEEYGGADWYARNVKEPYRTMVRESVRPNMAYEIKDRSEAIAGDILADMQTRYEDTPIEVVSVTVGNIDYPDEVNNAIKEKLAAEQTLQKKEIEEKIAERDAKIRVKESEGIAESQRIINETLTPNYLQHEALKVQEKLAQSPNTTIIYIPVGQSGIPIVHNSEAEQVGLETKVQQ
jgi:regulator of protease activity HflC (stomatin/prohibitin superfamily)